MSAARWAVRTLACAALAAAVIGAYVFVVCVAISRSL